MKVIRKSLFAFLVVLLLLVLLRGPLYRFTVRYTSIGQRALIPVEHPDLKTKIQAASLSLDHPSEQDLIQLALQITASTLHFTTKSTSQNPNKLIQHHAANCVGYSAFFSTVLQALIEAQGLRQVLEVQHLIGKMSFLGMNMHDWFNSPFFKDHDFNAIVNKQTGEITYLDPSVRDYLWIDEVWVAEP